MIRVTFILSILMLSIWASPTLKTMKKESRVAIVVGNSSYDDHALSTSSTNARKMKKFLEENGFYVYYGENLDKRNFVRLLRKFNKRLRPNGIGLVYYSGHAVQTKGKNYLVTVENGILDESMIARKSISLNSIYSGMEESYNRLNIVVLDTAFDTPFGTQFTPKKSGLAADKSPKAQVTFMANHPNKHNSSTTFSNDFLSLAEEKGLELTALEAKLIDLRQTHRQPQPQITIAKNQPFYFVLPDRIPSPDELAYTKIKNSNSKNELEKFINKYPKSTFTKKAQDQLDTINKEEAALKEKRRQEFEAKAAEATRKAKEIAAKAAEAKELAEKEAKEKEAAAKAAQQKNDIAFKLTKPEDVIEEKPIKPEEGEERQILLE
ncbi:MAG: caspase family protein [Sulfurimonadaceae bacterium]